jgi:hypothetical protein
VSYVTVAPIRQPPPSALTTSTPDRNTQPTQRDHHRHFFRLSGTPGQAPADRQLED